MSMYNKIFTKILDSSVWLEPTPTRIVWITLIAAMDENGFCPFAAVGNVAARAHVTHEEAQAALDTLEGPDAESSDPENEGRRIERVPGGWIVLNAPKYRALVTRVNIQEKVRERVRRYREKKRSGNAPVTASNADVTQGNGSVTPSEAEADTEAKKTKAKAPAKDRPSPFSLPEWINAGTWKDFEEMRQRKRAPLTDRARRGIMAELEKIRNAGGDPEPVLLQSITNAWSGVFPLKTANGGVSGQRYSIWDELKKSIAADQDGAGDDGGVPGS